MTSLVSGCLTFPWSSSPLSWSLHQCVPPSLWESLPLFLRVSLLLTPPSSSPPLSGPYMSCFWQT